MSDRWVWCVVFISAYFVPTAPPACAQLIPTNSTLSALESFVDVTWTNHAMAGVSQPGEAYSMKVGPIAYGSSMETNFLSQLIPITNETVVLYPVYVIETNDTSRRRLFLASDDTVVHTAAVDTADYPEDWLESRFGEPPSYLSGSELDQWYLDRDPIHGRMSFELLSTSDVPAYVSILTNGVVAQTSTQSWEAILARFETEVAVVGVFPSEGWKTVYLHAPGSVRVMDVYRTTNLTETLGWSLRAIMNHGVDPVAFYDSSSLTVAHFATADAELDNDVDGLVDGRELLLYGTDPFDGDTDGDDLGDGAELLGFSSDALSWDTDGDGMRDGWEALNGLDPTSTNGVHGAGGDADGDSLSNWQEYLAGTDPTDNDITPPTVSVEVPGHQQVLWVVP